MALTHIQIAKAKTCGKAYKLPDGDALYLLVRPSGTKLWRMNYRYLGRQKTLPPMVIRLLPVAIDGLGR